MLELPIEETDHLSCTDHPGWMKRTDEFLRARGLFFVEIDVTKAMPRLPEGMLVILGCNTKRALPHVVIATIKHVEFQEDGQPTKSEWMLVHDPHPDCSIETVDSLFLICKLEPYTIT